MQQKTLLQLPGFLVRFVIRGALGQNYASSCLSCSLWLGSAPLSAWPSCDHHPNESQARLPAFLPSGSIFCATHRLTVWQARPGKVCVAAPASRGRAQASQASFLFQQLLQQPLRMQHESPALLSQTSCTVLALLSQQIEPPY